jgi:pyruvate/2-oxoglutarate/acetoin dehydrogenase E1 component
LQPIVELMTMNFGIVALDQIVNNAAKIRYMSGGQLSVPVRDSWSRQRGAPTRAHSIRKAWKLGSAMCRV